MSTFRQKLWGVLTLLSVSGAQAATYILPEKSGYMGAEGLALGGAIGARSNRGDFMFSNPASAVLEKKYTLGARYSTAGDLMGAQIVDTSSSSLGGSVGYYRREFKNIDFAQDPSLGNFDRSETQIGISLSAKVADNVGLGITARYHHLSKSILPSQTYWSGDVGVIVNISPAWNLGLVGQDLLQDDLGYLYRNFILSLHGAINPQFKIMGQVDFTRNPEGSQDTGFVIQEATPSYRVALEYGINSEFILRTSYAALRSWDTNYLGFGLAYKQESFGLDYGLRSAMGNAKGLVHAVSLSVDI